MWVEGCSGAERMGSHVAQRVFCRWGGRHRRTEAVVAHTILGVHTMPEALWLVWFYFYIPPTQAAYYYGARFWANELFTRLSGD